MLLKSLEIKGFKSFADPVSIEFEPGITVIVGPNGSGKSNIVDAICWVMGTQATSNLRTSSMQEVIFAGSNARKPLGRAKVTITIDNSDRTLPIDLSEVAISRTLFRNGESEYAINGTPCRLIDIQELLSDSGVGKQLHTIVGQGQLDAVLTATPQDRRSMIEEAAGILKYKKRRERASRRLASTEENLSRIYDVIAEIKRHMRPLQRQAAQVERYKEVSAEVALLRHLLAWRKLRNARLAQRGAKKRLDTAHQAVEQLRTLVASLQEEAESLASHGDEVSSLRRMTDELVQKLVELRNACGSLGDVAREKKKFYGAVAIRSGAQHLDLLGAEIDQLEEKLAEIDIALPALRDQLEQAIVEEHLLAEEANTLRMQVGAESEVALRAAEAAGERSSLESSIARAEIEASQVVERAQALERRLKELAAERERLDGEIRRLDARAQPLSEEVSRLRALRDVTKGEIEELGKEKEKAQSDLAIWNGRLEALKELAAEQASTEGPARIKEASPRGVVGSLQDFIEVEPGAEAALEAALGEFTDAVVIVGEDGLWSAAAVLEEGEGVAWLLDIQSLAREAGRKVGFRNRPVSSVPPSSEAIPLVTYVRVRSDEERIAPLIQALIARCYVVSDFKLAVELSMRYPELTFITKEGGIAEAGAYRVGRQRSGPFSRLALLTDVALKAREAESRVRAVSADLARQRQELSTIERDLEATELALEECDAALTAAASELGRVDPELARVEEERAAVKKAESSLAVRIRQDRERLEEIEKFLDELRVGAEAHKHSEKDEGNDIRDRILEVEKELGVARERRRQIEKLLASTEERHAVLSSRREQIVEKLKVERERLAGEDGRRRLAFALSKKAESIEKAAGDLLLLLSSLQDDAEASLERVRPLDESNRRRLSMVHKRLEEASEKLQAVAEAAQQAEIEEVRASTLLEQVELEYVAATGEQPPGSPLSSGGDAVGETNSGLEGLESNSDGRGEGAYLDGPSFPPEIETLDDAAAQAQLEALEKDLERIGPVNQLALKDFEEASARLDFYTSQARDLEDSKAELQKVISAIDGQIEVLFRHAFDDVARAFQETFEALFEGGKGRIYLQDPSAPLDSGVEVEARPAGKSVKRLSLLSGGERSLAALAFLFAIYRARPGPFYILDEVEAALDDLNLERFLRLVKGFRDHGQVVIITHQKRTVEVADCLYGVSMQSEGVSKVVSYKVSESLTYS